MLDFDTYGRRQASESKLGKDVLFQFQERSVCAELRPIALRFSRALQSCIEEP